MKRTKAICLLLLLPFLSAQTNQTRRELRSNRDYAVFFAVNDYQPDSGFEDLNKPIENAEAISKELKERYGFETEVVKNPTLDQISSKLRYYQTLFAKNTQGRYPANGQLLLFFIGHGIAEDNNGYFVPADGDLKKLYSTAFAYEIWRPFINKIECRHIFVAIDACYSVTFDPEWYNRTMSGGEFSRPGERSEGERLLLANEADKSRIVFTSDGKEDKVPERSNFTRKFLAALQNNTRADGILTSQDLAANLRFATPSPRLTEFGSDENGSFLFVLQKKPAATDTRSAEEIARDLEAWRTAKNNDNTNAYREYLAKFSKGEFREQAEARIKTLESEAARRRDDLAWEIAHEKNTTADFQQYLDQFPGGRHAAEAQTRLKTLPEVSPSGGFAENMAFIQGGAFIMGCSKESKECDGDEKPAHEVVLRDFYLGRFEVTQAEWRRVMGSDPPELHFKKCDQCPVEGVSWNEVQKFLAKLNAKNPGKNYRLPTEAEWEYAARGGNLDRHYKYAGSDNIDEVAWYFGNSGNTTHPVGKKMNNQLGLFDMTGNVFEWCSDWYGAYPPGKQYSPAGPMASSTRACRGGSWGDGPAASRTINRGSSGPDNRDNYLGFRIARY